MTGPTRRELEQRVDNLAEQLGGDEEILFARCDPVTGDLEDSDGNPIDPNNHGADTLIRYRSVIVMERERAEKEGREIIGPYEDAPEGRDLVELPDRPMKRDDLQDGVTSR